VKKILDVRKKLRSELVKSGGKIATSHAVKGFQPSAQEVAQYCATSCAL
jgi:hypothetical protein